MDTREQSTEQPSEIEQKLVKIIVKTASKDRIAPISYYHPKKSITDAVEKLPEDKESGEVRKLLEQISEDAMHLSLRRLEHTFHIIRTDPNARFNFGWFAKYLTKRDKCGYVGDTATVKDFYNTYVEDFYKTYCAAENDTDIPDEFTKELS